jgi:hypothetical protein
VLCICFTLGGGGGQDGAIAERIIILDTKQLHDKNYITLKQKIGSDCTGTLMFVKELFSLMTLHIYLCKSGKIFEM